MTPKTLAAFAIVVTLCIGILIGALGHGAYLSSEDKKMRSIPPSQFFVTDLERTIQPDEKQRDTISKILSRRSDEIAAIMDRHVQEIRAIIDSTQTDLTPILNEEQQRRLKERLERGMTGPPRMITTEPLVDRMREHLGLNGEQIEKIQKLLEASQKEITKLLEAHRGDPEAVRDSVETIMLGTETRIKSLLTLEQQKKFKELRKEPFGFGPGEFPPPKSERE
jgi:argonaute-like protein implicated in RNA metabolism and viral defense